MLEFIKDIGEFFKERKKWWLLPIIIALLLIACLAVLGSSTALTPFIYTLF